MSYDEFNVFTKIYPREIIFEAIIKEKNSKDEMAQKIIASKTGEKTPKDKEINISSWYQYDTIQRTSEVNDEIW
ncbi:11119_t:CDS:2, partial [Entrophospora sp. SA101]